MVVTEVRKTSHILLQQAYSQHALCEVVTSVLVKYVFFVFLWALLTERTHNSMVGDKNLNGLGRVPRNAEPKKKCQEKNLK